MIAETLAHLKETLSTTFRLIGGAADFQKAVENKPTATPALFVLTMGEKAKPPSTANVLIQHVDAQLGIVMVVRNVADNTGQAAGIEMEALRLALKDALFGWQPASQYNPLERDQGNLMDYREGHLWWLDTFNTSYLDKAKQ